MTERLRPVLEERMLSQVVAAAAFFAALGSGLMAGLFFTYSNSVMPSLARAPVPQGVLAMNTR